MNTAVHTAGHTPAPAPLGQDAAVIGLVGLAHASSHFSHLLLAPLFPMFMRDFGLSFTDVGALVTIFFIISGIGQALSGFVVDRVGARPVLFGAISCFLVAALVASQATSYGYLVAAAALAGFGNAPFHPVDFTILNQRVSSHRLGHAFSVHGLSGNLGWALSPVFLVGFASLGDWRHGYYAAALMYAGILLLLWTQRDRLLTQVVSRKPAAGAAAPGGDLAFLRLPVVWWCFSFFLLSTVALAVVQSFAPSILEKVHGVSVEVATYTLSAYMLSGAFGMLVGGFVAHSTQFSDRVVASAMTAGGLLMLVCASGVLGGTGTLVGLAMTGFSVGIGGPSRDLMIKRATPAGATGRVYGTVYSGLDTGFALSPLIFGRLMDHGHYTITLAGAGVALLASVVAVVAVGRHLHGRAA